MCITAEELSPKPNAATSLPHPRCGSATDASFLKLLGDRVREARARRGMTRKILARDSGVSERYLAQLETGQGNISILLLRDIARALDLPVEALVYDGPEPPIDLVHTTEFLRRLPAARAGRSPQPAGRAFWRRRSGGAPRTHCA